MCRYILNRNSAINNVDNTYLFQITAVKVKFKAMHGKVKDFFDDIQQSVEKRRQEVSSLVQAEEDTAMTSLADLEKDRAAMTSHAGTIDHLVTSAPDDGLLQTLKQLTSRLNTLESESGTTDKVKAVSDISFDTQMLTRLKSDLSTLGMSLMKCGMRK